MHSSHLCIKHDWNFCFLEARTIDVSRISCNEQVNLDFAYLLYLNYDGDSLDHENMCKYTVTTSNDDKKICVIVQKFYVTSAHAYSTKVEYHTHFYTSTEDQVRLHLFINVDLKNILYLQTKFWCCIFNFNKFKKLT